MSKAIRIHEAGGPEAMRFEECDPGAPAEGEVQLRHTAIGLNYIDVYDRSGLYPMPLPGGLGREAAGVVVAVGRKARGFRKGDRVAYVHTQPGSYSEVRNVPASRLVKLPKSVSDEQAAALIFRDSVVGAQKLESFFVTQNIFGHSRFCVRDRCRLIHSFKEERHRNIQRVSDIPQT